jgi:hypothetical protein
MADKTQSFVLAHDGSTSSFQQVLKGDRSIDALGRAVHDRKAGNTFVAINSAALQQVQIGVDESGATILSTELTCGDVGDIRSLTMTIRAMIAG